MSDHPTVAQPKLLTGAALTVVGLAIIGLVRLVAPIAARRYFGIDGLTYLTAAMAIATIATIIGPAGMAAGVTKLLSELRASNRLDEASAFRAHAIRWSGLLTAAGAAVATAYASLDDRVAGGGGLVVASVSALTLVFGIYQLGKAIAYGEGEVGGYVARELVGGVAFVAVLWLLVSGGDAAWVVVPLVAVYVPVASMAFRSLRGAPTDPVRTEFRTYSIVGITGSLAGIGFTYVTPLVAGYLDPELGTALVGAALALVGPIYLAPRAIGLVLLPGMAATRATGSAGGGETLRLATASTVIMAAPICAVFAIDGVRIVDLVFSLDGGPVLAWFSLAVIISVAGAPAITALAAIRAKFAAISMWSSLAGFGVAAIVWWIARSSGAVAVAAGYALGSLIQVAVPIWVATREYGVRWRGLWPRLGVAAGFVAFLALQVSSLAGDIAAVVAIGLLLAPEIRALVIRIRA